RQIKDIADVLFKLSEFVTGIIHPRGPHGAAQLPAKRFVPFPTTSLVLAAATTVARLVAAQPRRKDDLTHPVRSFLAQGETHRQPFRSPTRMLATGPVTSPWASFSWTVDATAPAVEHSRRRPQPRRPWTRVAARPEDGSAPLTPSGYARRASSHPPWIA